MNLIVVINLSLFVFKHIIVISYNTTYIIVNTTTMNTFE